MLCWRFLCQCLKLIEKDQEWIGAVIDESVEQQFPELFPEPFEKYYGSYIKYDVPFKKALIKSLYAINILENMSALIKEHIIKASKTADLSSTQIDGKYKNTFAYIDYVNLKYLAD